MRLKNKTKRTTAPSEVNFFAAAALLREVLPGMRGRGRGTIINISSMDGIASLPVNGWYASSKFALEGLTEALWQELEPIGLRAFLVEPGSFRTGLETRTRFSGTTIDSYAATSGAFREMLKTITPEMWPGDPARGAAAIYKVAKSRRDPALGDPRQRRPPPHRREARHAADRVRRRQRTRVQHRLPRPNRPHRPLTVSPSSRAKVSGRERREPPLKASRRTHVAALIAVASVMVLASSDFYARRFWLDHPATTAILASLGVVLVSVTVIEVILSRRSERRWRLLAQYSLLELAEAAREAWGVLLHVVDTDGNDSDETADPSRVTRVLDSPELAPAFRHKVEELLGDPCTREDLQESLSRTLDLSRELISRWGAVLTGSSSFSELFDRHIR